MAKARRQRGSGETTTAYRDSLSAAIRNFQLVYAVATAAERAATHDLVEVHCLADVFVALISLIDNGLHALNELEARP
jgi:hypothetical protein